MKFSEKQDCFSLFNVTTLRESHLLSTCNNSKVVFTRAIKPTSHPNIDLDHIATSINQSKIKTKRQFIYFSSKQFGFTVWTFGFAQQCFFANAKGSICLLVNKQILYFAFAQQCWCTFLTCLRLSLYWFWSFSSLGRFAERKQVENGLHCIQM